MNVYMNLFVWLENFRSKRKITSCILLLLISISSCDSENANDCLQTDGSSVSYLVELPLFDKIQLEDDIRLIIEEGPEQRVTVNTGENLVSDLTITVKEGFLVLQNNNNCNLLREFGRTLITVTSPNITFIRQASSFEVQSRGTLSYQDLTIWSNTNGSPIGIDDPNKSGKVILDINVESLQIQANGSSAFELSGSARMASIGFTDELPQLNAENLLIDDLRISHVSAANMIVHPIHSIMGQIRATGDVIAVNQPPIVEVEEFFTGRLIFE